MGKKKLAEKLTVELKELFVITFERPDEYLQYLCYVDGTESQAQAIRKSQAAEKYRLQPHTDGSVVCNRESALVSVQHGKLVAYCAATEAPVIAGSEALDIALAVERRAALAKLTDREKEVLGLGKEKK